MSDIGTRRLKITIWFLLTVLIVMLVVPAWADPHPHDEGGGGDVDIDITGGDLIGGSLTGGDLIGGDTNVSTGGNRALAISNSLGDVDFTGICQGSSQFGTPVFSKQRIHRDEVCLGFAFLKIGAYDLAQMHFCMDKETLAQYATVKACENEHDFKPATKEGRGGFDSDDRNAQFEEHYELAQQQEHEIEYLKEEQASLVGRIDYLTERIERAPAPQQQIQQIDTGAERRANSRAAYEKALAEGTEEDE